jgi:hypothetical protein
MVSNSLPILKDEIRSAVAKAKRNEDLSEKGKRRQVAKHAVDGVAKFREAQKRVARELAEQRAKIQGRTKEKIPGATDESKYQIAAWLRSIPMEERNSILRDAAAGRMAGGDEVMAAVISSFPRLLGYKDEDPNVQLVRDQWLSRVAPNSITELADLDEAEAALRLAGQELEEFATEMVGEEFAESLAVLEGRKPWSSLTAAEKAEEVAKGERHISDLMREGVEKTDADYDREYEQAQKAEEDEKWASMTLAEKVAAVQQRAE